MQQAQGRELVLNRKNGTAVARILAASAGIGGRGAAASSFASLRVTLPASSDSEPAETIVASLSYDAEGRPIVDQPEEAQQPPVRPATELSLTVRAREEQPHLAGTTALTTWVARLTGRTTFEVVASRGGFDGRETALLRLRIPEARRIHASYLFSDWWTRPAFPRQMADLPARTQFLLWERRDGLFCCLVPLVHGDLRATLQGAAASAGLQTAAAAASAAHAVSPTQSATVDLTADDLDILVATEKSGLSSFAGLLFVLGAGPDPYSLVEAVYRRALQAINLNELAAETVGNAPAYRAPAYVARGRRDKRFPDVFEYLGWCSWDAFYQQVNAAGLLEKARELRSLQLPVRWVLIDDGWSPVQNRLLAGFGSDKEKFPAGLASVIRELKAELGFGWVGVWHALTGYWRGVDPAAPEMATVAGNLLLTSAGTTVPGFTPEAAFGFYHAWHSRLQQQGVDFIKVDNQGAVYRHARESAPIARAAAAWQYGLQASAGLHFDGRLLNCMAMSCDLVWFWNASNVARSSDDFFPNREGSAREHALQNIYNSLWLGELAWPDWDMWWTNHPQARYHQALRAISGGPVYVSDPLGKTDPELLWPLIFSDGRVLRCDEPARPTRDTLFSQPTALKAFNRVGNSGILGIFWAGDGESSVQTTASVTDVEGLGVPAGRANGAEAGTPLFALHEHYTGQRLLVSPEEKLEVVLKPWEARVYSFVPVQRLTAPISLSFAPIGLVNKIISPRAVLDCELERIEPIQDALQGRPGGCLRGRITLYEGGRFLAYCDRRPLRVEVISTISISTGERATDSATSKRPLEGNLLTWSWAGNWLEVDIPAGLLRPTIEIVWQEH